MSDRWADVAHALIDSEFARPVFGFAAVLVGIGAIWLTVEYPELPVCVDWVFWGVGGLCGLVDRDLLGNRPWRIQNLRNWIVQLCLLIQASNDLREIKKTVD